MNISLTDEMKAEVDTAVSTRGYVSSSEYIRDLIRRDLAERELQQLLLDGLNSPVVGVADEAYFEGLRTRLGHKNTDAD
ncbi:MAG: ribbon-helix-helix domain-containing protein [Alphaproteobacteria bacterium]